MICERMRSTSALSKCGEVSARCSRSKASSLLSLQHAQRAAEIIAGRAEGELDGAAVEPLVERLGIEIAGAFVDQARRPCWRRRACRRDPAPRRRRRHIPSRSAARSRPARTRPRCRRARSDAGSLPRPATARGSARARAKRSGERERGAPREVGTDGSRTLLLALRRGVLDQIAGDRALLVQPFLRRGADLFGGDRADAVRPASDVLDAEPRGERAAIPARQRRLVVLGVDRLRDQLRLDPLEILGADRVLLRYRR